MSAPVINSAQINALLEESNKWRLIPTNSNVDTTPEPSMVYGASHLVRLFGKIKYFILKQLSSKIILFNTQITFSEIT